MRFGLFLMSVAALSGCGLLESSAMGNLAALEQSASGSFKGLQIGSIEALPVMCPCYELLAEAPGRKVRISYEVVAHVARPQSIKVNGEHLERDEWHALGTALLEARIISEERVKNVQDLAKYLTAYGERYLK